ncbi:MAG: LysR family transcriptional regulator [Proteobacteria bacterium]|nr:MAG: LysR family transcriptional regulator [Pseudomonadota bacterium]
MFQLPPLNSLRVLESVARNLSFSKAADELFVTKAAVSHQIKALEEYLGIQLFERKSRSIELTEATELALPMLREGFNNLAEAVKLMQQHDQHASVNVCMAPSFAAKWLMPRLQSFSGAHPEIDMQIIGDDTLIGNRAESGRIDEWFCRDDIDVVIRFGSGDYPGFLVDKLFDVSAVPLCSPKLLAEGEYPLREPDDLRHHTLLHDDTGYKGRPSWAKWLELAGVHGIDAKRGLHFNHVLLVLAGAVDEQGIGLSMEPLAQHDIDAGRLCIPFDLKMPLESSYYIIRRKKEMQSEAVEAFVSWMLEEARTGVAEPD